MSSPWFPVLSILGKPCDHRDKPVPKGFSLSPFICLINLIKVGLTYSIVLISTIQQSDSIQCDSVICLYTHTHTHTHTHSHRVSWYIYIGLAQRFIQVFPYNDMQQPKRIFGSIQYILFYSLFHYGLSQDIESSSLCSIVEPWLSILYKVVLRLLIPHSQSITLSPQQTIAKSLSFRTLSDILAGESFRESGEVWVFLFHSWVVKVLWDGGAPWKEG